MMFMAIHVHVKKGGLYGKVGGNIPLETYSLMSDA